MCSEVSNVDLNLTTLVAAMADEQKATEFFESRRWPGGDVYCPHCGEFGAYKLVPKPISKRPRKGAFKCRRCRKQFSVRTGTVLAESKLPLRKWLMIYHLMTASKKGVSARQIAREVGCTPKSAWFACMRVREAMRPHEAEKLCGDVEADETFVGGKPRYKGQSKRGRGTSKQPVVVLVERNGSSAATPVDHVDQATLHPMAMKHIDQSATLYTDEAAAYLGLGKHFSGGHHFVTHGSKEYVRHEGGKTITNNTAESWFALLKRAHYGIHHQWSKTHLRRYCDERSFMWNNRKVSDGERMVAAIEGAEGKRLYYRQPKRAK